LCSKNSYSVLHLSSIILFYFAPKIIWIHYLKSLSLLQMNLLIQYINYCFLNFSNLSAVHLHLLNQFKDCHHQIALLRSSNYLNFIMWINNLLLVCCIEKIFCKSGNISYLLLSYISLRNLSLLCQILLIEFKFWIILVL
jgi:hypothetical protein